MSMCFNEEKDIKLIAGLCDARGASGFEDEVLSIARGYGGAFADIEETSMRNLYLSKKGGAGDGGLPRLMLDAHSDEVGMIVQFINPSGTLSFLPLGGFAPNSLAGHKVWVRNSEGEYIKGVVAGKPVHFMSAEERGAAQPESALVIDVGASSDREARETYKLRIGEPCVPCVETEYDAPNGLFIAKALDCRIGCAAMLVTLERLLSESALDVSVHGALTSQEEVGTRGAATAARSIRPAAAIVFEGTPVDDTFLPPSQVQTALKKGPMLRIIDGGMITNPRFLRFALNVAEEKGIPVQTAVRSGGGTNGRAIQLSGGGVPVIVIGIPVRYLHTHHGIAAYDDFKNAVTLAVEVTKALNKTEIDGF